MTDTLALPRLPDSLRGQRLALTHALSRVNVPAEWSGQSFEGAEQPAAIADVLVSTLHRHLGNAKIAYLFREKMTDKLAVASKAGGKLAFLANVDFTIEFDWEKWRLLTAEQRIALVDHELCHCGVDDEKGKWVMWPHDVEEFGGIVHRWGLWRSNLTDFGAHMRPHLQGDLFNALARDLKGTLEATEGIESVTLTAPGHEPVELLKKAAAQA
jgi:hypothetical protein